MVIFAFRKPIPMSKATKNISTLKGEELFYHLTHNVNDEHSSLVALLPYATMNMNKAILLLENIVKSGKTLVAIYPGNGDVAPKGAELVGDISDGALYIK